ncbi:Hpt domain-containing protein [Hyphobacterium sp.]|uniref:Hpt domain-containing protein n=1 Tax=Hyphobacterium sp. TaxID=2004662 RepID=UPI003BAD5C5D
MIFDRAHLSQYTDGDEALEAELVGLLKEQAARCLAAMETAADENAWKAAAHTLKGAARGVGAFALGEACQRAEDTLQPAWPMALVDIRQKADEAFAKIEIALQR